MIGGGGGEGEKKEWLRLGIFGVVFSSLSFFFTRRRWSSKFRRFCDLRVWRAVLGLCALKLAKCAALRQGCVAQMQIYPTIVWLVKRSHNFMQG